MRSTVAAAGTAAVVAGLAGTAGIAGATSDTTAASAPAAATITRHFAVTSSTGTRLDLGKHGRSLGDQEVEYGNLLENGRQVGHQALQDQAVALSPTHGSLHMQFDLVLSTGQITAEGLATFGRSGNPVTVPVTGGTGTYRGASGELTLRPGDQGFQLDLTLTP